MIAFLSVLSMLISIATVALTLLLLMWMGGRFALVGWAVAVVAGAILILEALR